MQGAQEGATPSEPMVDDIAPVSPSRHNYGGFEPSDHGRRHGGAQAAFAASTGFAGLNGLPGPFAGVGVVGAYGGDARAFLPTEDEYGTYVGFSEASGAPYGPVDE